MNRKEIPNWGRAGIIITFYNARGCLQFLEIFQTVSSKMHKFEKDSKNRREGPTFLELGRPDELWGALGSSGEPCGAQSEAPGLDLSLQVSI